MHEILGKDKSHQTFSRCSLLLEVRAEVLFYLDPKHGGYAVRCLGTSSCLLQVVTGTLQYTCD